MYSRLIAFCKFTTVVGVRTQNCKLLCHMQRKVPYCRTCARLYGTNSTKDSRMICSMHHTYAAKATVLSFMAPQFSIQKLLFPAVHSEHFDVECIQETGYFFWLIRIVLDIIYIIFRFCQLLCTFVPLLLLYPVTFCSDGFKSLWYCGFLLGIEFSGPILIKLGQWASTRRDLFTEEFCDRLSTLQRRTRPHSWYYTEKSLQQAYGKNWRDVFLYIENNGKPIGSGCCAQVYKAWIREDSFRVYAPCGVRSAPNQGSLFVEAVEMFGIGHMLGHYKKPELDCEEKGLVPVAVKVLHPWMEVRVRQDVRILKAAAVLITNLVPPLRWLSLPECVDDFAMHMHDQINLHAEARNLETFAINFKKSPTVKFPYPLWSLTRPYILVESYENGEPLWDYVRKAQNPSLNRQLAAVGVNTILKMVFDDNFIHGDLHPGNMIIQHLDTKVPLLFTPFKLVILDCGIISSLDERGRVCLRNVFAAVAQGDGERVAELFLEHSNHKCTDVESFKRSMEKVVKKAVGKTLQQVDVGVLMQSLFRAMIFHHVKVDSSFSSVILAIMVLEGLGRSLDPDIDVLAKAVPFLIKNR